VRDVALLVQQHSGCLKVTTKVKGGDKRGGHHFGIGHVALAVIDLVQAAQQVVAQAIDGYNSRVHELLRGLSGGGRH